MAQMEPVRTSEALRGFEGLWVAIKAGAVVEAKATPDQLYVALRNRNIRDAVIIRVPAEDEPLMVGLG